MVYLFAHTAARLGRARPASNFVSPDYGRASGSPHYMHLLMIVMPGGDCGNVSHARASAQDFVLEGGWQRGGAGRTVKPLSPLSCVCVCVCVCVRVCGGPCQRG